MSDPKDLAVATAVHLNLYPEKHRQRAWRCETGMCYAGHYAALSGEVSWLLDDKEMDGLWHDEDFPRIYIEGGTWADISEIVVDRSGKRWKVSEWVAQHMGISDSESSRLFAGSNSREDVEALVKSYANGDKITQELWENGRFARRAARNA